MLSLVDSLIVETVSAMSGAYPVASSPQRTSIASAPSLSASSPMSAAGRS